MNIAIQLVRKARGELPADLRIYCVSPADITPKTKAKKGAKKKASGVIAEIDSWSGGVVSQAIVRFGYKAKVLEPLLVHALVDSKLVGVLLLGWESSDKDKFKEYSNYYRLGQILYDQISKFKAKEVSFHPGPVALSAVDKAQAFFHGLRLSDYEFKQYKSKTDDGDKQKDASANLHVITERALSSSIVQQSDTVSHAVMLARTLVNTPPADCNPDYLVDQCRKLAKRHQLKIDVWDRSKLKGLKAGGLLAVSQGSAFSPYLVKLVYKPSKKSSRVVSIVGKGITFDSGGLSIKPAGGMETMKMDMAGAAAVIATMSALATLKPKIEVRGYLAIAENMIGEKALRPGDVITALNGKTIEVLNTDAEGRLVLADALSMADKDKCDVMIDLATLTGACVVALGGEYAGLFTNEDLLCQRLIDCGVASNERFWRMPLAPEYKEMIKSPVADIKNTGGSGGGAITAALFLQEFVSKAKWAHIDIAGPAFSDRDKGYIKRGGVGFGVRTLLTYLCGKT